MVTTAGSQRHGAARETPTGRLKGEFQNLLGALGDRALSSVKERIGETAGRLTEYAENGGGPGLMAAATGAKDLAEGKSPAKALMGAGLTGATETVKGLFGGGGGKGGQGKGKKLKVTNIVEHADVGVPVRVAYNQWTQFRDFPSFTKKLESVEQESDEKLYWRAKIFWSTRNWESTIIHQIPDEAIVWRSKGAKGYVDGAVTFHELASSLTRILLVLEYNPKGFFEKTGNLWRAQGRRARLEFKHFQRHMMTQAILQPDEIEGWRGVIQDGEVVKDHETALREEAGSEDYDREAETVGADRSEETEPGYEEQADEVKPGYQGRGEGAYDEDEGYDEEEEYGSTDDEASGDEMGPAGEEYEEEGEAAEPERPQRPRPAVRRSRSRERTAGQRGRASSRAAR